MKTRVFDIKGCSTCDQVVLSFHIDDEGDYYVLIHAWHETKDDFLHYQEERVKMDSLDRLKRFVFDYSEISANEFANSVENIITNS